LAIALAKTRRSTADYVWSISNVHPINALPLSYLCKQQQLDNQQVKNIS